MSGPAQVATLLGLSVAIPLAVVMLARAAWWWCSRWWWTLRKRRAHEVVRLSAPLAWPRRRYPDWHPWHNTIVRPIDEFMDFLEQVREGCIQLAIAVSPAPLTPLWLPGIGNTARLAQVQGASRVRAWPGPQSPLASYPPGALELLTPRATPVARVHFDDDEVESFPIVTRFSRSAELATVLVEETPIYNEWALEFDTARRLAKARLKRALKTPTQEMRAVFDAMTEDWLCSHCDTNDHDSCPGCSCPTCLQVVSHAR